MLRPITCADCKKAVGWYETLKFNVAKPVMPAGINVLVAFLVCECGKWTKYDGEQMKRRKNKRRNAAVVVGQEPYSWPKAA